MKDLYIVNCCRTAIGKFQGSLANTPASDMGAVVIKEALKRAGVAPENVDEVIMGNAITGGQGQNPARQAAVKAGVPVSVPAYTVGMVCGSGLKAMIEGARAIKAGDAEIVVCGGMENMTMAPYAVPTARGGARMFDTKMVDTMVKDGLWDVFNDYHMGVTAENICDLWGITRQDLDEFAAASQQKCEKAQATGRFDDEIVPITVKQKKKEFEFKVDEFPRAGTTVETLAKLRPAFHISPESAEIQAQGKAIAAGDKNAAGPVKFTFEPVAVKGPAADAGTARVTAGNASGVNDGAACLILASGEAVEKYGLKPMAKLLSYGQGGVDPKIMGIGPVVSSRDALGKAGLTVDDMDLIEANEAFAAQSIAVARELGFDMSKVNVNGGALALGHPVGCSGARIVVTLLHEMQKRPEAKKGLATLCIGGGMSVAAVFEKV